jgi:hypothetical protein
MDNTAYIDAYIEGSLSPEEKLEFEQRLTVDHQFRTEYETHLASLDVVKSYGALQIKERLQAFENRRKGLPAKKVWIILAAAAFTGLFLASYYLIPFSSKDAPEQLFAFYFHPYRDPVSVRSGEVFEDIRDKANTAYRSGDFATAAAYYKQVAVPSEADHFYHAMSLLQAGQTENAIVLLSDIARVSGSYHEQAAWYLALAYLKTNRIEEAKAMLARIREKNYFMAEKAEELLKKLK